LTHENFSLLQGIMRQSNFYFILLIAILGVLIAGACIPVMDVDAAQYASISREMQETGSYLKIYNGGREYLDKPPLLFWLSSISISLFGAYSWAYKLPSILFSIWAAWGISRLGKQWFGQNAGYVSALIWMTCQGFFLMNLDVRTDLLLTSNIILAVWQFDRFLNERKIWSGIFAGFFTGLAMLSKGPLGLILPGIYVGLLMVQHPSCRDFLKNPKIWVWLPVLILVLTPMTIGLYQQFDLEGIYFYYWKQSFGRITGENEWRNGAGPFFLTQNLLWAALPWTFAWLGAFMEFLLQLKSNFYNAIRSKAAVLWSCILIPLIVLSRSHYQLPHYIFVVLPFLSLLTAAYLGRWMMQVQKQNFLLRFHVFQAVLCALAACFLEFFVFSSERMEFRVLWVLGIAIVFFWVVMNRKWESARFHLVFLPAITAILVNSYLNFSFYQGLLPYQPSVKISEYFRRSGQSPEKLFVYRYGASHSLDFFTRKTNLVIYEPKDIQMVGAKFLVTDEAGFLELYKALPEVRLVRVYPDYQVQFISLPFLNPATRANHVHKIYLIQV
jgi:4-amino-4-deoxy-L-arabinose transferase-like glycosyltransferase